MENMITISNVKDNVFEFDAQVQGVDTKDMTVRFVIEAEGIEFAFPANKVEGTKWEVSVPALDVLKRTAYNFHIDLITDGYHFEPLRGVVNVVGSADVYVSKPKSSVGPTDDVPESGTVDKSAAVKKVLRKKVEPEKVTPPKAGSRTIAQIAQDMMDKAKVKSASGDLDASDMTADASEPKTNKAEEKVVKAEEKKVEKAEAKEDDSTEKKEVKKGLKKIVAKEPEAEEPKADDNPVAKKEEKAEEPKEPEKKADDKKEEKVEAKKDDKKDDDKKEAMPSVKTPEPEALADKHDVSKSDIEAQLKKGIEHEKEHTKDEKTAREIALDHIKEDPKYYDKLDKIEESKRHKVDKKFAKKVKIRSDTGERPAINESASEGSTSSHNVQSGPDEPKKKKKVKDVKKILEAFSKPGTGSGGSFKKPTKAAPQPTKLKKIGKDKTVTEKVEDKEELFVTEAAASEKDQAMKDILAESNPTKTEEKSVTTSPIKKRGVTVH